ncbi:peptide-N4-(N-acetyl-beta-glucosaminyl) asparagineamidase A [Striga asiatica]|uniref:Peptide-N4-(N-acetyl-beta-glucosaminyl) asparagineamidase A n=1 Tax=Striga asiatica TaxID=4170 RepID=A0A5A7R607_STRAF|nr:peptide-N4-(N-acetyl-beta-glucosaminyl) asparagineamidase A [Striga asiatica]
MAPTFSLLLLLPILTLLHRPPLAAANLRTTSALFRSESIPNPASQPAADTPPTTFFEVTKPITVPNTKPCSYTVLEHEFAYTYGKPPVLADYKPPSSCLSQKFAKIVLEWTATCKGRQFDRIFGVWLGGVEILRSCTAEPRATGIIWTVKKDVTRYHSLLMTNQTLAVYLGNLIDSTYTGVYHVNVVFHFYPAEKLNHRRSDEFGEIGADLILPISRTLPLNDGLWFEIQNSTDVQSKEFDIPPNTHRAVLEVYVSFHENDEFWFGNYPNEYLSANNLTGSPGNGPFREVIVGLDNYIVGSIWPFTVIYTGGVNPLMWRPITGIGSFDLPSYDFEITPFLGELLDGKTHKLSFSVRNALNVWYLDANLHLWLDKKSARTEGELLEHKESPISLTLFSNFTGFDGLFLTNATRSIISTGRVKSSLGAITTKSVQEFGYSNRMAMGNDANLQILNQVIKSNCSVVMKKASSTVLYLESQKEFTLYLHSDIIDKGNKSYESVANVTLGFDEKRRVSSGVGTFTSKLENLQSAEGNVFVKGSLVVSGLGSTRQEYRYTSDNSCYFRNVSSSNYTIIHDEESCDCRKKLGLLPSFPRGDF